MIESDRKREIKTERESEPILIPEHGGLVQLPLDVIERTAELAITFCRPKKSINQTYDEYPPLLL